jgi:hypothetical protein
MTHRQQEGLILELGDVDTDICNRMRNIIGAKWDAPSLQHEVEKLMQQRELIIEEIREITPLR